MRIAAASSTPSASAVLNGLLALSSLHRHGVQTQAFRLKIATIKALAVAAAKATLTAREVIQHAAAGMLLCSFEVGIFSPKKKLSLPLASLIYQQVHQASCTSSQWTWYIAGVKGVLGSPCLDALSRDGDLNALMSWVHYHDVMSRFTMRHWHGHVLTIPIKPSHMCTKSPYKARLSMCLDSEFQPQSPAQIADPSMMSNLELLAELSDAVKPHAHEDMSPEQLHDYKRYVEIIDWRIRSIPIQYKIPPGNEYAVVTELFKLATLVYLNRITGNLLDQTKTIEAHLERAFTLFGRLGCCQRQYPLLIIGCEARTDEQRLTVLDAISRTENDHTSRSLNHVKILVQAMWAQDDLAEREIDYANKLSCVISSCTIIPSLV
jgi:hypothetical protein